MKSKKGLLAALLLLAFGSHAQTNIADARNYAIGQTVTVRGIAMNGSELGPIRYIQDATAAIPAYGSILNSVQRGDSVEVTGVLYEYNGLLEISPTNSFQDLGTGAIPAALQLPITSVSEAQEAQLVRFDNVTFVESGTFAGNTNYNITDGANTLQVRISTGSNLVGQTIPSGALTVMGLLGQFNSFQLLPRDQNDVIPYVAPIREINVKIGGATYLNGSEYVIGTNAVTTVTIENLGSGNLTISGASFAGAQSAEYSTPFTNQIIGATSSTTLNIVFAPAGNGSRLATLTIASDDTDEASYVIDLYGIGADGVATQPAANPTSLVFSNVKAYAFNGSYTASTSAEKYMVVWTNGAAVSGVPTDGVTYKRGDLIGNGKIAYVGPALSFAPRHVIANQNYHIAVFAFNGPEGYENYRSMSPLTGNVTSQGEQIGTYYNGISTSSSSFVADLSAVINPHTVISYGNYKPTVMNQFEIQDTTDGRSFVICAYSGEHKVFNDPFDWTSVGYSREHSYCHSWMPTFPADDPALPEYSDQHNLYPTNLNNANSPRSNLPMDEVTGNVVFNYMGGSVGYNGAQLVYEPRESHKGNAARAIFYMATAYNGINGNNWGLGSNQPQEVLKTWHFADLPDDYEIARNEYIFSQQNNRNPYVDSVNYVCFVSFQNMSYDADGCGLSLDAYLASNLTVFPVPTSEMLYAQVNGTTIEAVKVVDMSGRTILDQKGLSLPVYTQNIAGFDNGMYTIIVTTPLGTTNTTFVKE